MEKKNCCDPDASGQTVATWVEGQPTENRGEEPGRNCNGVEQVGAGEPPGGKDTGCSGGSLNDTKIAGGVLDVLGKSLKTYKKKKPRQRSVVKGEQAEEGGEHHRSRRTFIQGGFLSEKSPIA